MQRLLLSIGAGLLIAMSVVAQASTVSVQGNVNSPGTYSIDAGKMTLVDAIRRAGGVLAGSGDTAIVFRSDDHGTLHQIRVPLPRALDRGLPEFRLKPGDVLYVPGPGAKPRREPVIDDRISQ